MARFYLSTVNSRGNTVTAMGRASGQDAHLRGWNAGVEVVARDDGFGVDVFDVYMTHGSNGGGPRTLIGTVVDHESTPVWNPAKPAPTYTTV